MLAPIALGGVATRFAPTALRFAAEHLGDLGIAARRDPLAQQFRLTCHVRLMTNQAAAPAAGLDVVCVQVAAAIRKTSRSGRGVPRVQRFAMTPGAERQIPGARTFRTFVPARGSALDETRPRREREIVARGALSPGRGLVH